MKKLFSNKIFILILVTLLILAIIIIDSMPNKPLQGLTSPVSRTLNPVQSLFSSGGGKISDFFAAISDGMTLRKENEDLKNQVTVLEYELEKRKEAQERLDEFKEAFHVKDKFEQYDFFSAEVLTRESDEWFSIIRVSAGRDDGVRVEEGEALPVVDVASNLVGRVMSSDSTSAKVLPLLHEGFSVIAKVDKINGAVVRVHGEASLKERGYCKVDQIPSASQLEIGDVLVTSGGELFPSDIPIGEIVAIEKESELFSYALLKPYADITQLRNILIMVAKEKPVESTALPPAVAGATTSVPEDSGAGMSTPVAAEPPEGSTTVTLPNMDESEPLG